MTAFLYALGVVIFLIAIFVSIALHELGHLHYAKKFGCRVSEYMVGFGPTVWSRKLGETEYGIKLVPLGGYVKIIGMFPPEKGETIEQAVERSKELKRQREAAAEKPGGGADAAPSPEREPEVVLRKSNTGLFAQMVSRSRSAEFELVEPGDEDRLFYKLPWHRKMLVMLAGPGVNICIAFVCFLGVYGIHGVHTVEPTGEPVVATVADCLIDESEGRTTCAADDPYSPARMAGLEVGDEIVAFNGEPVETWDEVSALVHANQDGPLQLDVVRDGEQVSLSQTSTVTMARDLDGTGETTTVGYLGVSPVSEEVVTRHGPIYTMIQMGETTAHAVTSIAQLPVKVWNVAQAVVGVDERDQDGPMSIVGGSRLAGEVTSSDAEGLDIGGKTALLVMFIGSFNLFIGVFNLVPLLPLDGGHILGAAWEGLRKGIAKVRRKADPGYVNVAAQLPLAYCIGLALVSMGLVLMIGDLVVPLRTGL
ncbi:M50 family metallopeptidase [Brevibacterium oceani]|uniref:M50 family metallopeptidase n=1 Tax=Brevibacterium oceani TaxID=358099 RepID=UPI0015E6E493|nr:M50 family metallopeptidase [Brevibacterium oceani]